MLKRYGRGHRLDPGGENSFNGYTISLRAENHIAQGASAAVELAGRMVIKKYGQGQLGEVAKLHFRTTKQVLGDA